MRLPIHNPTPATGKRGGKKKKKTKRSSGRAKQETAMAKRKKKKSGKRKNARARKNPAAPKRKKSRGRKNPAKRSTKSTRRASGRRNPGKTKNSSRRKKRRRNPEEGMNPYLKVGIAVGAGVLATAVVTVAATLFPQQRAAQLGAAGAGVVGGGMLAAKGRPMLGAAVAAGSAVPVAIGPVLGFIATHVLPSKAAPSGAPTTSGMGAIHRMGAIHQLPPRMGAFEPSQHAPYEAQTPWGPATN